MCRLGCASATRIIPAYAGCTFGAPVPWAPGPGSSPHTRGAPYSWDRAGLSARIIPAYAGCTGGSRPAPRQGSDHPRIRGVHTRFSVVVSAGIGSSPHTRGAPAGAPNDLSADGIIPAYAGCTSFATHGVPYRKDHPRIRGVHVITSTEPITLGGSSPHTRGARGRGVCHGSVLRIIPAYAGCTTASSPGKLPAQDHPRIRGVHYGWQWRHQTPLGIIPAYAGCTRRCRRSSRTPADHPRIRGVHAACGLRITLYGGSSPHTRGARAHGRSMARARRIIPAYAGCTHRRPSQARRRQDHPRIRGVHVMPTGPSRSVRGSSPHTRGAHRLPEPIEHPRRIIPAYAGCTGILVSPEPPQPDHPRIRGVHRLLPPPGTAASGSSPHTRGALEDEEGWA